MIWHQCGRLQKNDIVSVGTGCTGRLQSALASLPRAPVGGLASNRTGTRPRPAQCNRVRMSCSKNNGTAIKRCTRTQHLNFLLIEMSHDTNPRLRG